MSACIWDADTLDNEKKKKPEIAEVIFGTRKDTTDASQLRKRIADLKSAPREDEAAWWNNLAGAHLRLGQPQEAVNLLEPILKKFDSDYGVHANLGTAYHLLGRYQEAEKEIARDLEINPEALRFGKISPGSASISFPQCGISKAARLCGRMD
ncbi:MAG: tetratricopeptide repeat protein [Verrucomicrobiota bacterium]